MSWRRPKNWALLVDCPVCEAPIGADCSGTSSKIGVQSYHAERRWLVRKPYRGEARLNNHTRSAKAAAYVLEHGVTLRDAAKQFGISHQAVSLAWNARDLGKTPVRKAVADRQDKIAEFVAWGDMTAVEIARELDAHPGEVHRIAREIGLELPNGVQRADPKMIAAGMEAIQNGSTVAEGAKIAGVMRQCLQRYMRVAGIRSTAVGGHERWGLSEKASALVDDGWSVAKAARELGVSVNALKTWRKRRGLFIPIGKPGRPRDKDTSR